MNHFFTRILQCVFHLKYPEVTTSFSLSLEVVLDGLAPDPAAAASEAGGGLPSAFSSSMGPPCGGGGTIHI